MKTLASSTVVMISHDRIIKPFLLFQIFAIVSQSTDLSLEEIMQYELCPYPPSLFEAKNQLRKQICSDGSVAKLCLL